jgi:hypothetical protein
VGVLIAACQHTNCPDASVSRCVEAVEVGYWVQLSVAGLVVTLAVPPVAAIPVSAAIEK